MTIRLVFGNPGNHNRLILYFLLGRHGHRGQLVYYYLRKTYTYVFGVAIAVQWHLQWRGTPCTPPPQKGGEQRCNQMYRSGLAGGYLMYPFDEQKSF